MFSVNDIIDLMIDDCEVEVYSFEKGDNVYNGYASCVDDDILEQEALSIECYNNKFIINIE